MQSSLSNLVIVGECIPTPTDKEYHKWKCLKESYPSHLFLFRYDNDYLLFGEDAKNAAAVLGVAACEGTPSYSYFPYYQALDNLGKLLKAGYTVAVYDPNDIMFT